ncbi:MULTISPECIES: LysM domain-containing protein [unclassified Lactobacillus]|uniref:LysM peptidoglycan-binding domain-containing protein n=1 Tax=unclassified Lactobacillus TaxID=2620435 RepID=UPI000EFD0DAE|nr:MULTISPECIES: LysM domain-containing protein [unclassified Lactobacillus]RMC24434.1 LysM domain-containing protein [Lactobacillus sp. ESL0247]RMC28573.1 LysM domain-containing protein [Lactobacillus sp. ESL0246]RMC31764.1 LysM domain-containing protein [Lactobacillus sp. ESL0245]
MADDSKKDIKDNNIANTNTDTSKPSVSQTKEDSKTVDVPVTDSIGNWQQNKGGEQIMAKDPEGMFDYSKCQTYTVKKSDTLFDVAQKFEVALQQLRYFNHLDKATWRIREGQTLYIPTKPIHVPTGK